MAKQALRTLSDDGKPGGRPALAARAMAPRLGVSALLAAMALVAWTGIVGVAQASGVGHSTAAELATCVGDAEQLGSPEPARYRQHDAAPPQGELEVVEAEQTEEPVGFDVPSLIGCTPRVLPGFHHRSQALRVAPATYKAQFRVSSALPRGPPSSRR